MIQDDLGEEGWCCGVVKVVLLVFLENFLSCAFLVGGSAERHSVSAFQEQIPGVYLDVPRRFVRQFLLEKLTELSRSRGTIRDGWYARKMAVYVWVQWLRVES